MTHIHPVDLIAVVENLSVGEQVIYYIGALAIDGDVKERGKLIAATGIIAWDLYEEGIVTLINKRLKEGEYEYILRKRKSDKIPFKIVNKALHLQEKYNASTKLE